jgi:chromosome segregation ATPase
MVGAIIGLGMSYRTFLIFPGLVADICIRPSVTREFVVPEFRILFGQPSEMFMSSEMSFAQALTEARQIIVQQSNRIKTDLEKIKALQDTITSLSGTVSSSERKIHEQADELAKRDEQIAGLSGQVKEATVAREQAEAVVDRQGQRLTQAQETITKLEKQSAEHDEQIHQLSDEIESLRRHLPTQEDSDALASLSELLSNKKVSMPAAGQGSVQMMRLASERAQAA